MGKSGFLEEGKSAVDIKAGSFALQRLLVNITISFSLSFSL